MSALVLVFFMNKVNEIDFVCGTPYFQHAENVLRTVRIMLGRGSFDDFEEVRYFFDRNEDCPRQYQHLFSHELEYRAFCFLKADWDNDKQRLSPEDVVLVERRFNELKAVPAPVKRAREVVVRRSWFGRWWKGLLP